MRGLLKGVSYVAILERRAGGWKLSAASRRSDELARHVKRFKAGDKNLWLSDAFVFKADDRLPCGLTAYRHQGETFVQFVQLLSPWYDGLLKAKPGFTDMDGRPACVTCLVLNHVEGKYDPMNF